MVEEEVVKIGCYGDGGAHRGLPNTCVQLSCRQLVKRSLVMKSTSVQRVKVMREMRGVASLVRLIRIDWFRTDWYANRMQHVYVDYIGIYLSKCWNFGVFVFRFRGGRNADPVIPVFLGVVVILKKKPPGPASRSIASGDMRQSMECTCF
ncbi:unnamed protein product [Toxocara canis]|uniref:Transmembrane protein n=1 Tax=Toxocara canis TaxID=6265 RepID=A0A183UHV1_TOXCA|nr:unnamed protein product [Toxocara canis]